MERFWYILGCITFGAAYLQKVPVKKALSDYGLVKMTGAESFWYVLGCIFFGGAYFMKIPVAKALSELPRHQAAPDAPNGQLRTADAGGTAVPETRQALPGQSLESKQEQEQEQEQRNPG